MKQEIQPIPKLTIRYSAHAKIERESSIRQRLRQTMLHAAINGTKMLYYLQNFVRYGYEAAVASKPHLIWDMLNLMLKDTGRPMKRTLRFGTSHVQK